MEAGLFLACNLKSFVTAGLDDLFKPYISLTPYHVSNQQKTVTWFKNFKQERIVIQLDGECLLTLLHSSNYVQLPYCHRLYFKMKL